MTNRSFVSKDELTDAAERRVGGMSPLEALGFSFRVSPAYKLSAVET